MAVHTHAQQGWHQGPNSPFPLFNSKECIRLPQPVITTHMSIPGDHPRMCPRTPSLHIRIQHPIRSSPLHPYSQQPIHFTPHRSSHRNVPPFSLPHSSRVPLLLSRSQVQVIRDMLHSLVLAPLLVVPRYEHKRGAWTWWKRGKWVTLDSGVTGTRTMPLRGHSGPALLRSYGTRTLCGTIFVTRNSHANFDHSLGISAVGNTHAFKSSLSPFLHSIPCRTVPEHSPPTYPRPSPPPFYPSNGYLCYPCVRSYIT
jgi:hypothetical protein